MITDDWVLKTQNLPVINTQCKTFEKAQSKHALIN
jgi:hypothetical protein